MTGLVIVINAVKMAGLMVVANVVKRAVLVVVINVVKNGLSDGGQKSKCGFGGCLQCDENNRLSGCGHCEKK